MESSSYAILGGGAGTGPGRPLLRLRRAPEGAPHPGRRTRAGDVVRLSWRRPRPEAPLYISLKASIDILKLLLGIVHKATFASRKATPRSTTFVSTTPKNLAERRSKTSILSTIDLRARADKCVPASDVFPVYRATFRPPRGPKPRTFRDPHREFREFWRETSFSGGSTT